MKTVMLKCQSNGNMQLNPCSRPGPTPTTYNVAVENVPISVPDTVVLDTINKTVVACPYDMYIWDWSDFGKSNFVNYYKGAKMATRKYLINIDWQEEIYETEPVPPKCRAIPVVASSLQEALDLANERLSEQDREDLNRYRAGVL